MVYGQILYKEQIAVGGDLFEVAEIVEEVTVKVLNLNYALVALVILLASVIFVIVYKEKIKHVKGLLALKFDKLKRYPLGLLSRYKDKATKKEFEVMDKGLLEAVMKEDIHIDTDIYKSIEMLRNYGYNKQKIRKMLINAGFDLVDIDDAIEAFFERKRHRKK